MNRRIPGGLPGGGALALALSALAGGAQAQDAYPNAPFREHPAELARAVGLERVAATARAFAQPETAKAGAEDADAGQDADEQSSGAEEGEADEGLMAGALPLFEASLADSAPELAKGLKAAVTEMLEARDEGEDSAPAAREVLGLTEKARAALVPADLAARAPFQAAVMAALLLDEGGVAESYEEASEGEAEGYLIGFAALTRAKGLWAEVKAKAEGATEAGAEGETALASLDALFPSAEMPAHLSPDPEEAEAPAHAVVAAAEALAQADLYPGRDLGAAAEVVRGLAEQGCAVWGSDPAKGREWLAIAGQYGGALLADPLSVMAPEAGAAMSRGFEAVAEGAAPDCAALLQALGAAKAALAS